ncbi:MAG: hypothetical protein LBK02_00320 [Treponema sp.]|jgi:hypothetical protein|nr:hypothetical protein [Treponema sp.]
MKNIKKSGLFSLALLLVPLFMQDCHSNRQAPVSAAVTGSEGVMENRDVSLYLLYVPGGEDEASRYAHKKRFESSHIPQAVAAFFPAQFVYSPGKWVWSFQADISYQITNELDLQANLRKYEVRASGSGLETGAGRRYRITFRLADLNSASIIRQPGLYALEQATLRAAAETGYARLESISYNPARKMFRAEVIVITG